MDHNHIEFARGWELIKKGIRKLKNMIEKGSEPRFTSEEFIMFYTVVYDLCTSNQNKDNNYSKQLYTRFRDTCEYFIEERHKECSPSPNQPDEFALRWLVRRWGYHKAMTRLLIIFDYLDRYYIPRNSLRSLHELVEDHIVQDSAYLRVNTFARDAILLFIDKERKGEEIDRALVKNGINAFAGIGMGQVDVYERDFESFMLRETGEYYSPKALSWIVEECSDADYVSKAEECLRIEMDRISYYLPSCSQHKMEQKVQHALFEPLANKFKQKVMAEGKKLVQDAAKNISSSRGVGMPEHILVQNLIKLHHKCVAYVYDDFKNYYHFHKALKEAFEVLCNKPVGGSSSAEVLASFFDNLLKRGESTETRMSGQEVEDTLREVVDTLLPYLSDNCKFLFTEFYRKRLARRLLLDHCLSKDRENRILTQMKQQCGSHFTSKMEVMIRDVEMFPNIQRLFEEHLQSNPSLNPGMDMTVTVLTTSYWPNYKFCDVNLPAEMATCVEVYNGFYKTEAKRRKLQWIYSLGSCIIVGKFDLKNIELVVSTYQAALLLLFNTADTLRYSQIATELNLNREDLARTLHSLSCAEYKILIKKPSSQAISPNDIFVFNTKFAHKKRRIKIRLPQVVVDERKAVIGAVNKDRRYSIDAVIVRIMKSGKVLVYQQLLTECVDQLRHIFKPDIRSMKERIEDLITREYLERDKKDLKLLKYLA